MLLNVPAARLLSDGEEMIAYALLFFQDIMHLSLDCSTPSIPIVDGSELPCAVAYLENRQGGQPQEGAPSYLKGATGPQGAAGRLQSVVLLTFFGTPPSINILLAFL